MLICRFVLAAMKFMDKAGAHTLLTFLSMYVKICVGNLDCIQTQRLMCRFTLAALEHSDKAEAQRALALVRRHGGRRFTAQTLHLLQGVDKANILALCPCSFPKQMAAQLQTWGDFTSGKSSFLGFPSYFRQVLVV